MGKNSCGGSNREPDANGCCVVCGQPVDIKRNGKAKMHQPPSTGGYGRKW